MTYEETKAQRGYATSTSHTASKLQSQDSELRQLCPESILFPVFPYTSLSTSLCSFPIGTSICRGKKQNAVVLHQKTKKGKFKSNSCFSSMKMLTLFGFLSFFLNISFNLLLFTDPIPLNKWASTLQTWLRLFICHRVLR